MLESERPIVLASTSVTRRRLLEAVGLRFEIAAPNLDEAAIAARLASIGASPATIAEALAAAKAAVVAERRGGVVIGSDQVLDLDGAALGKVDTRAAAAERLRRLAGRSHRLATAVAVRDGERTLGHAVRETVVSLRPFSEAALERYLDAAGERILGSVACYELEGLGATLVERIEGDWFAALGLPVLDLLAILRRHAVLAQ